MLIKAAVGQFVKVTVFPTDGTVVNLRAWRALVLQPFLQEGNIGKGHISIMVHPQVIPSSVQQVVILLGLRL